MAIHATDTAPPLPEPANPDGFSLSGDPGDWSLYSPKQITERDNWFLDHLRAAEADAQECATVLMELVALKDLKALAASKNERHGAGNNETAALLREYNRRKLLAWAAARAMCDRLEK